MRFHPLYQLTLVKLRELLREPEALFWIFVFPVLLALALGIAFRAQGPQQSIVAVETGPGADELAEVLENAADLRARLLSPEEARDQLRRGTVGLVVIPGEPPTYWYDPTRPESRLAFLNVDDALQRAAGRGDALSFRTREMTEKGSRYIDFLVPGLIGMNIMSTGMWGIGFYIVNARSKGLLKRLIATPMRRSHYLLAQIAGRLVFLFLEVGVLVLFAAWIFEVPLRGSWVALGLVSAFGGLTFAGLGLLVAARPRTIEGVSGLMNLVMMPMWILSGIFFSTERFPELLQPVVQALPLTALIDALRAVMLDGAGLAEIALELLVTAAWGAATFLLALTTFRWS